MIDTDYSEKGKGKIVLEEDNVVLYPENLSIRFIIIVVMHTALNFIPKITRAWISLLENSF